MSGIAGRRQAEPIPESQDEHAAPAAPAVVPVPARSGSDSDHTLAADRDVEAANLDDEDQYPIVGEPLYIQQKLLERKQAQLEAAARKKNHEKEKESKPEEKKKKEEDPFLITLKGREKLNPHTWNSKYRWALTGLAGLLVLNSTFASSGPSQLLPSIEQYFGFSSEVGTLTIALFVSRPFASRERAANTHCFNRLRDTAYKFTLYNISEQFKLTSLHWTVY
jgi:hypothetical protein